jgi:hypothetical protein
MSYSSGVSAAQYPLPFPNSKLFLPCPFPNLSAISMRKHTFPPFTSASNRGILQPPQQNRPLHHHNIINQQTGILAQLVERWSHNKISLGIRVIQRS